MDEDETIENLFGFEDLSESEGDEVTEVNEITKNNTNQNSGNQEAQVRKRRIIRKNIPKLDSNVLLSENGLIKLQNLLAKAQFKRGKGHERENLSRLINVYQLWGHNLYPRLKFKSIIERTEKLCSEKRLRIAYMTWKEANKYKRKYETNEYNESGIIRDDGNNDGFNNDNGSMDIDIFKPYSMATTVENSTVSSSQSMPTFNTFTNNNLASASSSISASTSFSNSTSASASNPNGLPLSRLSHPLTEEERAFSRANRERALKKLREKKEALRRQQELLQQQQQTEQEQQSTTL